MWEQMILDIWNGNISKFEDPGNDMIYHIQVIKDAKVTNFGPQTPVGLSFTGKITVSQFKQNWNKKSNHTCNFLIFS